MKAKEIIFFLFIIGCKEKPLPKPAIDPNEQYKHMTREQLLNAYDSIFALVAPDDPLRYKYRAKEIYVYPHDTIYTIKDTIYIKNVHCDITGNYDFK